MPRVADPARQLQDTIARLQDRRRTLVAELAKIDDLCARYGIQLGEPKRPGRPAGRVASTEPKAVRGSGRRKRGRFAKSAHVSVVDFLKGVGAKGATTGEINKHWLSEGRAGSAYVTLGQLTKARKIKRQNIKGARGSRYTLA